MTIFSKNLTDYFPRYSLPWATRPVNEAPATTFLKDVVHICDSVNHCIRTFTRKKNGSFTKNSADSYQHIVASAFALLMSHFETYQKTQFGEIVNNLDFMDAVDDIELAKRLEKEGCSLKIQSILVGRGNPREPGQIISDALPGWHNPGQVNKYFKTIFPQFNFYSNDIKSELELMWQLRHSIVHNAGVITREDAAKVAALRSYNDKKLILGQEFMPAIGRRFHIMLQLSLKGLENEIQDNNQIAEYLESPEDFVSALIGVESPRKSWFRS